MEEDFRHFIHQHKLCTADESILLGISGGVDSMVMASLFLKTGYEVAIAHCNFQLRGSESDGDEAFVRDYAERMNVTFYSIRFETKEYAGKYGISVQMAARELRINWMNGLAGKYGYSWMAMAHHLDDEAETFFLNLLRGTGIAGLHGILPKSGNIIHPLMFARRDEINQYANNHAIAFRTDSSNLKAEYSRNKVRHLIIPELEKIKSGFTKKLGETIQHLRSAELIYRKHLENTWEEISETGRGLTRISIPRLKELPETKTYLFEFLNPFGFSTTDCDQIMSSLENQPGKTFQSGTHRLLLDREHMLLTQIPHPAGEIESVEIDEDVKQIQTPLNLNLMIRTKEQEFSIKQDPTIGQFDADKINFPLKVRRWEKGDFFHPLGMTGRKLLSDFFIDHKLSLLQKENVWVMTTNNSVMWVIGYRMDDRFKITGKTSRVLEISYHPES